MLGGSKCLQTGLSQALPARCGSFGSASRHTKTRIDCSTAAMDGRLPGPRKGSTSQVPHLVLGRPSREEKTDGRGTLAWSTFHQPRLVQPQIHDTHPQPQTDRYRRRLRESDVTLPGWGANLDGDRRHRPFWEAASRSSVSRDQSPHRHDVIEPRGVGGLACLIAVTGLRPSGKASFTAGRHSTRRSRPGMQRARLSDVNVNPCWRPPVPRAKAETTALVEAVDPVRKMRHSPPDSSALDLDTVFTQ